MSRVMGPDDELIPLYEATEHSWKQYLNEFNEKVWPIFEQRGFSRDMALMVWFLSRRIDEVLDAVAELQNDDEEFS